MYVELANVYLCTSHCYAVSLKVFAMLQDPAIAFAKKGYHILLEKPMAVSLSVSVKYIIVHYIHLPPEMLSSFIEIEDY
jgi:hypothetical protein